MPIVFPIALVPSELVPVQTSLGYCEFRFWSMGAKCACDHRLPVDTNVPSTLKMGVVDVSCSPMWSLALIVTLETIAFQDTLLPLYVAPGASADTKLSYVARSLLVAAVLVDVTKIIRKFAPGLSPAGVLIDPADAVPAVIAASATTHNTKNNFFINSLSGYELSHWLETIPITHRVRVLPHLAMTRHFACDAAVGHVPKNDLHQTGNRGITLIGTSPKLTSRKL